MSVLEGLAGYYKLFGMKGVAAICSYRAVGMPHELTAHPEGLRSRVYLRTRTTDVSVYNSILLGKEYDLALPFLPKVIVDAGANCGMATVYFANKYPDARVVAIEPEPSNYRALVKNTRSYPNVVTVQAAVWSRDCQLSLQPESHPDKDAFRVSESGTGIRGITIPSIMQETGISSIDLFKIDVEGAESELFESPVWLQYVKAMAVEFHEKLKPGCKARAEAVCGEFRSWQRGETTFFVRG